ncbi:hypothetical protein J1C56_02300 [Aminobacter anthyllidis]|uniref:Glycoside hydrolase family 19 catalytic domain-containing protein n=1 Tax=Aminobacter anthyllidis TaxID=1035067 RepID=A0A9X1A6U5_9HYPH|nr:glycoside hydrolase family 19 protein [Aminobacter anthyllidis]MBT1154416.1 hypothetical protein [Aminobacter anthyllidis]
MNKKAFFDSIRAALFDGKLSGAQVHGLELLIAEGDKRLTGNESLAYILATATWETAWTLKPIAEYGKGKGRKYGVRDPRTGKVYYGRGYVQLTWDFNYKKMGDWLGIDLYANPDLAMVAETAVKIIFEGMERGMFTGKKLADYLDDVDESDEADFAEFKAARRIVNGTDRDDEIGRIALKYEKALRLSGRTGGAVLIDTGVAPVVVVDTFAPPTPKKPSGLLRLILTIIKATF